MPYETRRTRLQTNPTSNDIDTPVTAAKPPRQRIKNKNKEASQDVLVS